MAASVSEAGREQCGVSGHDVAEQFADDGRAEGSAHHCAGKSVDGECLREYTEWQAALHDGGEEDDVMRTLLRP